MDSDDTDYDTDHLNSCRTCLIMFDESDVKIQITNIIREMYHDVAFEI